MSCHVMLCHDTNTHNCHNNFITGLTFNAKRTICIKFHHGHHVNAITQYTIFLGNDKLKWYSQVKHLRHTFNCCVNFSADVTYRKGQFIGCVNTIIT